MVFTDLAWVEPDGRRTYSNFRKYRPRDGHVLEAAIRNPCVANPAMMIRREVFDVVRFDESLRFGEGVDFALRLAVEFQIGLIDRPLVEVRHHDGNMSFERESDYWNELNVKYEEFMELFERIRRDCPQLRGEYASEVRRGLGRVYLDWGRDLYCLGRMPEARSKLRQAWRRGIRPQTGVLFAKTWIPKRLREPLRHLAKRVKK